MVAAVDCATGGYKAHLSLEAPTEPKHPGSSVQTAPRRRPEHPRRGYTDRQVRLDGFVLSFSTTCHQTDDGVDKQRWLLAVYLSGHVQGASCPADMFTQAAFTPVL